VQHVTTDELDRAPTRTDADRRVLTEALGTTDVAINHYRLAPDDRLSAGLHAHADQEEVFVVTEGVVTFYTDETDDDTVTVEAGEAIRFGREEFQTGVNHGNEAAAVVALGGPRDSEEVLVPRVCPECAADAVRAVPNDDGTAGFVCPDCGEAGDDIDILEDGMVGIGPP
jgi:Cupin domain.